MKIVIPKWLTNKFLLTSIVFTVYALFLDDWDIFHLIKQNSKLTELKEQREITKKKMEDAVQTLAKLRTPAGIEAFAREEKYFKKNDEDIFVISYE